MRRVTVLVASALINASTIPGLATPTPNKDVFVARAVSASVQSKLDKAADNEKACRAYAASSYESAVLRQIAAGRVDGARMLTAVESVINAFKDVFATKCGS
ncbi:hypothetical protein ACNJX9_39075 [Bradyrhizobium sp. DASA03076]|uniref:hypothetical protein n=1 Tax=Bradyrhizobium sp. BLXBL-03 TaxID=3395916 RepID=UPI003F714988